MYIIKPHYWKKTQILLKRFLLMLKDEARCKEILILNPDNVTAVRSPREQKRDTS